MTAAPDHPRFRDLVLLGRGSMGVVYRAYDTLRQQPVALKTLPRLDPDEVYWLKSEFRALADVRHPNLAELHELVVGGAHCFFTMELVDGVELVTWAAHLLRDRDAGADPARWALLDDCVRQLVAGVRALHEAGKLHRDIKPSNVLVTPERRVVLLDFGLAIPLRRGPGGSRGGEIAGTLAYMAPEQARGLPLSTKADWYSVGVVLYEMLTGEVPFRGAPFAGDKRDATELRARVASAPQRHRELIVALLDSDPSRRPSPDDILSRLETDAEDDRLRAWQVGEEFVGRLGELHTLQRSLERAEGGESVSVHVVGESGIGKTTLLQRFTEALELDQGSLVLQGRCHPHESVPYKALDGVVDSLTTRLLRLDETIDSLLPADVGALLQLFPVLGRVPTLATRSEPLGMQDPIETRRRGMAALRDLLAKLSLQQPIVVLIDDLQWGDADSATLLRALLAPPQVLRLLLVLSYRSEDEATSPMLADLARTPLEHEPIRHTTIRLGPLSRGEAHALARRLLGERSGSHGAAAEVARETGGSPFLIHQVVHHRRAAATAPTRVAALGNVVLDRLGALDAPSRRILEIVSLAAAPLAPEAALEAAGVGTGGHSRLTLMHAASLLRLTPHGEREAVRPYHDRIREAVVAEIPAERLREYHRILARALAARPDPDPEALFTHYLGAGDTRAAVVQVEKAAHRAAEALAFDRAASLYATTLELEEPGVERLDLHVWLAEALKNCGRTAEAGKRFLEAATLLAASEPHGSRLHGLRRAAAECLLRSGRFAEGTDVFWQEMRSVGVERPKSERDAFLRTLMLRVPSMVGRFRVRPQRGVTPPEVLHRLEILWQAAMSLTMSDHSIGAYISAKFIREGSSTPEPWVLARAIGWEAALENTVGGRYFQRRAQRLLAVMDRVVEWESDPLTIAFAHTMRGSCAWFDGYFRLSAEHFQRAVDIIRECRGVYWEIATAQVYVVSALGFLGHMHALSERLEGLLRDALERGDLFAANNYRVGQQSFCRLAADEPERALALAEEAAASMPADTFHIQRYHHLTITVQSHLYRREPERAWEILERAWPRLRAAQFLRLVFPRVELLHLRARAAVALAAALRAEPGAHARRRVGWTANELVRHAARLAWGIRRARTLPARPFAATIDAGVAWLRGDPDEARSRLEEAVDGFREAEMLLHREAARYQLGRMVGGVDGEAVRADAENQLAEQVKRPEAVVWTLVPGLGEP